MEHIERRIILLRGRRVLLSTDLAGLYGVQPRALIQAVKRNRQRFPEDFMFQLTMEEVRSLLPSKASSNNDCKESAIPRSQFVILESGKGSFPRSQIVTLESGKNIKFAPHAFTQEGVAMLSSVLRSPMAVQVNIEIMRAFVRLRYGLGLRRETLKKLIELERKVHGHDADIGQLFELLGELKEAPDERKEIGFRRPGE